MLKTLKPILEIQELDMKMIRLMRVKKERQRELDNINRIKAELQNQVSMKEEEITNLKKEIRLGETSVKEVLETVKKLEARQSSVKKVEEFNALTHEMSAADKDKHAKELRLSDLYDKQAIEDDTLKQLKEALEQTIQNSKALEAEILDSIRQINAEGRGLKTERDKLVKTAESSTFEIYERLLRNKKDRVVVPIENRCCSGCHIMVTAQDENLVRKGERLVFCEHCSRIHFWQESQELEGAAITPTKRRRRPSKV